MLLSLMVLGLAVIASLAAGAAHSNVSGAASPAPAGQTVASGSLDPRIAHLAASSPGHLIQAIVQFGPNVSATEARADVARVGGHVFAQLHIIPALGVSLTAAQASRLAGDPGIHAVSLNATVRSSSFGLGPVSRLLHAPLATTYDQTSGATSLWRDGLVGRGVGVAVIDTGIDGQLPDFVSESGGSRVIATAVTNPAAKTVMDTYGHGTDVAGIIAGNGTMLPASDPLRGQYVGVAPQANLIAIKASDDTGAATVLNVIYGLQFAVEHSRQYNIRVVNLSLDAATPQSYRTDPLDAAVEAAWMRGLVVVAAAGNRGGADGAVNYAPANDPYVITVGATDEHGTPDPSDDTVAGWSSRGITQDGFAKPDVVAPGAHIVSVLAPNSAFSKLCPGCAIGGEYIKTSGTSMAAPIVSGLVADILSGNPSLRPDQIKAMVTDPGAFSNPTIRELNGYLAHQVSPDQPANRGLTPSTLLTSADFFGPVDPSASSWSASSWSASSWSASSWSASSWSASSWSVATGSLAAGFAASSWSCVCSDAATQPVGTSASSWSASSWSASSWSTLEPMVSEPETVSPTSPEGQAIVGAADGWQGGGNGEGDQ